MKKTIIMILPLLLFLILVIPYRYVNRELIVEWLGCGCPQVDTETGEIIENSFNANDFTACFWLFVSLCVTTISAFLTKLLPKDKTWLKVLYVVCMLAVSLLISYLFTRSMMWN